MRVEYHYTCARTHISFIYNRYYVTLATDSVIHQSKKQNQSKQKHIACF